MQFGVIGQTGPGMRQIVGFGDQSMGRGTFGVEFGARHCNQRGLYSVGVRQCHVAALFPNYFGQTYYVDRHAHCQMPAKTVSCFAAKLACRVLVMVMMIATMMMPVLNIDSCVFWYSCDTVLLFNVKMACMRLLLLCSQMENILLDERGT